MPSSLVRFALPALLASVVASAPCAAQDVVPGIAYLGGYAPSYGQAGYGANLIDGSYVGAPLTRVPSPREIVPSPWSYGTYGVPTVSGIRRAPVGEPVVYVIEGSRPAPAARARTGSRVLTRDGEGGWSNLSAESGGGGGARIVEVRVPRR